jgi:hypothetical protein
VSGLAPLEFGVPLNPINCLRRQIGFSAINPLGRQTQCLCALKILGPSAGWKQWKPRSYINNHRVLTGSPNLLRPSGDSRGTPGNSYSQDYLVTGASWHRHTAHSGRELLPSSLASAGGGLERLEPVPVLLLLLGPHLLFPLGFLKPLDSRASGTASCGWGLGEPRGPRPTAKGPKDTPSELRHGGKTPRPPPGFCRAGRAWSFSGGRPGQG